MLMMDTRLDTKFIYHIIHFTKDEDYLQTDRYIKGYKSNKNVKLK